MWVRRKTGAGEGFIIAVIAPAPGADGVGQTLVAFAEERADRPTLAPLDDVEIFEDRFDVPMRISVDDMGRLLTLWREFRDAREFNDVVTASNERAIDRFREKRRAAYRSRGDVSIVAFRYKLMRSFLMAAWDPIGVCDVPEAEDEYDSYLPGLYELLVSDQPPDLIAAYLHRIETEMMGLPGDRWRAERVAERLLALRGDPNWGEWSVNPPPLPPVRR